MPSHFILHQFTQVDLGRALQEVSELSLSRYDNPFEQKLFLASWVKADLQSKGTLTWCIGALFQTAPIARMLLDLPISYVDWRHYGGLFVYTAGDYLAPHVDAGIHPNTGERKVATICLYLTPATLSFWQREPATRNDPEVWLESHIQVKAGEAILFSNHDEAWHSVPQLSTNSTTQPRVCITMSYMADKDFKHSRYQNPRTRAYFARQHGTKDTPELAALRQQRASETQHQEVYRLT